MQMELRMFSPTLSALFLSSGSTPQSRTLIIICNILMGVLVFFIMFLFNIFLSNIPTPHTQPRLMWHLFLVQPFDILKLDCSLVYLLFVFSDIPYLELLSQHSSSGQLKLILVLTAILGGARGWGVVVV